MTTIWTEFGFSQTPYRTTPLAPNDFDYELFTSRARGESASFLTAMDSNSGSFVIVSGDVGIGKTSFVNIQQHLLANGGAEFGPTLIPCFTSTPLGQEDTPVALARRFVHEAISNIERYCGQTNQSVPTACAKVREWMFSHKPMTSGYQITVGPLGIGRSVVVPPAVDATLETWRDVLQLLATETREHLSVEGFVVCMENAENCEIHDLAKLLMGYRDVLFVIEGIWWILIGPSHLYEQLTIADRRVSQRIKGSGIEMSHFTIEEFHDLIERRVKKYRKTETAVSPLSKNIHDLLFRASKGEVRFTLDAASTLVDTIVMKVREEVQKDHLRPVAPQVARAMLSKVLQKELIDKQIPDTLAKRVLSAEVRKYVEQHRKTSNFFEKIKCFASGSLTENDFEQVGYDKADRFRDEFLERFRAEGLLFRESREGQHRYSLKGFAWLANELSVDVL